ncbi:MAG TPA: ferritin-like domain-containing protein [Aquella sp.]|nr:ferritin-like domain-containing protein [Aquella sp.]
MTTLVGKEQDFKDVVVDLIELEYGVIDAYQLAAKKMFHPEYKAKMKEFLSDHQHHVDKIKEFYATRLSDLPVSGDFVKGTMAKMKVTIGDITGSDINILKAMFDNEMDTNTAYQRIAEHPGLTGEEERVFADAYQDEKECKKWLETTIDSAIRH